MTVRSFTAPYLEIPFNWILARLGYNKKHTMIDEATLELIREVEKLAKTLIAPKAHSAEVAIESRDELSVRFANGLSLNSAKLAKTLRDSAKCTLIAATIGPDVESETLRLNKAGELTRSVILDAVGSEAAEAFIVFVQENLEREKALTGYKPTMRYSPGYGDLSLAVQPTLLATLEAGMLGITTDAESHLMHPQKSITAIVGWEKK